MTDEKLRAAVDLAAFGCRDQLSRALGNDCYPDTWERLLAKVRALLDADPGPDTAPVAGPGQVLIEGVWLAVDEDGDYAVLGDSLNSSTITRRDVAEQVKANTSGQVSIMTVAPFVVDLPTDGPPVTVAVGAAEVSDDQG